MNNFKRLNQILGWTAFVIALITYTITMEKTGSLWDCGEFLSCTYKLQVAHPPGAPFYMMVGKLFSLFSFGNPMYLAMCINFLSALSTAFCTLFFYWSSVILLQMSLFKDDEEVSTTKANLVLIVSFLGALGATFLDSMWFNALEGEVYSFAFFFITFNVWAILKWYNDKSENADYWLLLIALLTGMSLGVHLLALLTFPMIGLAIYYKKFQQTKYGAWIAFAMGIIMTFYVMKIENSLTSSFLGKMDLLFVNSFGLPFYSGSIVGTALIIGLFYFLIKKSTENPNFLKWNETRFKFPLNTVVLIFAFMYMGYLSNYMVVIRANANPPINMNVPNNFLTLKTYLDREQYGSRPLISGPNYPDLNEVVDIVPNSKLYYKNTATGKYDEIGENSTPVYSPTVKKFFPRLGHEGEDKKAYYRMWINPEYEVIDRATNQVVQTFGRGQAEEAENFASQQNMQAQPGQYIVKDKLTFFDNMKYFFQYQIGFMYFRYLMWNTAGRNNDFQGRVNNDNGRWIMGIGFLDDLIGTFWGNAEMTEKGMPSFLADNRSYNKFYLIPFLLCVMGMYYSYKTDRKTFWMLVALFITTGLLQVIQTNEPPSEPRERDYAVAPSFWVFMLWLPFGAMYLYQLLREKVQMQPAFYATIAITAIAPLLMGFIGWDDHNRGNRTSVRDFAWDMLESCPPNAILFTYGDNDTYPLWYAQELENVRPDVRVINTSLIDGDPYIDQMRLPMNQSAPIKLSFTQDKIRGNTRQYFRFSQSALENDTLTINQFVDFLTSDDPRTKVTYNNGVSENFVPTTHLKIDFDREKVLKSGFLTQATSIDQIPASINFEVPSTMYRGTMVVLDVIQNNLYNRPICFATSNPAANTSGLSDYLQKEGLVYMFSPTGKKLENGLEIVNIKKMEAMMKKMRYGGLENNILLDEHILLAYNTIKNPMVSLALQYAIQGDTAGTKRVLREIYKHFTFEKFPLNMFDIAPLQAAVIVQDKEMGDKLKMGIFNNTTSELDWATDQSNRKKVTLYQDEIRSYLQTLNSLKDLMSRSGDSVMVKKIDDKFTEYESILSVKLK